MGGTINARGELPGITTNKSDPVFRLRWVLRVGQERLDVVDKTFERLRAQDTDGEVAA